ncbi:uncharacterized protein RHIMIDRAFT_235220 [Rhizopus microsporus ATCC 52813]|uniref:Uncharacterized protein n=1 Tax=Rhizopus microsporus ATCC 52813 TaxID=1340429 RepID=A0A2G4T097_RHIZD|nr:uncharacterized protein RHIMIDRAFT_235220 [Rhizopus microsporus ATCC 52813]PHZ14445.1 hypothetical protein RHIMIDRAFT_235220 [Rhizopus microsporus ATCC 52813]
MILDPRGIIWNDYFTAAEINEIKTYNLKQLLNISETLQRYMDSYDKNWETVFSLYEYADNQRHSPVTDFDKKWVRKSMMNVSELFLHNQRSNLNDHSEGEKNGIAVTLARSEGRNLEAID